MKRLMIVLTVSLLLSAACTDNITNHYYGTETGTIAGRVSPIDPETAVSTSCGTYQTIVDDNGYFLLNQMQPGIYHIVLTPADYSRREIDGVVVNPGVTKDLGQITLSTLPYPIYQTKPADGDESVYSRTYVSLYTDESLNLENLTVGTRITPATEGTWQESPSGGSFRYTYEIMDRGRFRLGTTYQVTIDPSVETSAGIPLGAPVVFSFKTEHLATIVGLPDEGASGGIPIWGFQPRISFNEYVYRDSVAHAVSFSPSIQGIWLVDYYREPAGEKANGFRFFPTIPPLSPETTYSLIISDQIALDDGVNLPKPDTTLFTTEPYGVTLVNPPDGYSSMPSSAPVSLTFNIEMDTASVEPAFTLTGMDGNPVQGGFEWETNHRWMEFRPSEPLHSGHVYKITLSTEASMASGENLSRALESNFAVR